MSKEWGLGPFETDTVFYVVYNPESDKPITRRFTDETTAGRVARDMAVKYQGEDFYVLKAVSRSRCGGLTTVNLKGEGDE